MGEGDWRSLKVAELKVALAERGLVQSGKKADLIARLEEHDAKKGDEVVDDTQDEPKVKEKSEEVVGGGTEDVVHKGDVAAHDDDDDDAPKEEEHVANTEEKPQKEQDKTVEKPAGANEKGGRKRPLETAATTTPLEGQGKKSRALCVLGFQRPFTLTAARALLEQYGSIVDMWMPSIKDRAYVVYSTMAEAEKASAGVTGVTWPANSTKTLEPSYVSIEEAEKAISLGTGNAEYSIARTDEDPVVAKPTEKPPPQKRQNVAQDAVTKESAFRSTTAQPMIYWKTCKPLVSTTIE